MGKRIELTVQLENKPGTLANLGDALGKAKVNILAFMADEVQGQSKVRLVTDNPAKAKKALAGQNLQVSEEEVVGMKLANKPGTLAAAASKLGGAGVNISHGYTGAEEGSKEQLVVLAVSDLKQATKVLK
jgi:hypothetical protein